MKNLFHLPKMNVSDSAPIKGRLALWLHLLNSRNEFSDLLFKNAISTTPSYMIMLALCLRPSYKENAIERKKWAWIGIVCDTKAPPTKNFRKFRTCWSALAKCDRALFIRMIRFLVCFTQQRQIFCLSLALILTVSDKNARSSKNILERHKQGSKVECLHRASYPWRGSLG